MTRSKVAAGRQNETIYLSTAVGMPDGWESRLRDALPPVAGRARSLRKAHVNPYHKALMSLCGIYEDGTAVKYALFRAQNGPGGMKNSSMHHLSIPR